MFFKCTGSLVVNPDDSLSCSSWSSLDITQLSQEIATELSLNTPLSPDDFNYYWGVILLLFVTAFSAKLMRRILGF